MPKVVHVSSHDVRGLQQVLTMATIGQRAVGKSRFFMSGRYAELTKTTGTDVYLHTHLQVAQWRQSCAVTSSAEVQAVKDQNSTPFASTNPIACVRGGAVSDMYMLVSEIDRLLCGHYLPGSCILCGDESLRPLSPVLLRILTLPAYREAMSTCMEGGGCGCK